MFYWSFTSLAHIWPPPIFNPGYAYVCGGSFRCTVAHAGLREYGENTVCLFYQL